MEWWNNTSVGLGIPLVFAVKKPMEISNIYIVHYDTQKQKNGKFKEMVYL